MNRRWKKSIVALAAMVVAALLAPAASARAFEIVTESYVVETRHGDVYVEVARPVDGSKTIKAPAVFTYSPYSAIYPRGRTAGWESWVEDGYARVFADVIGTGNSGGCWDYGGIRERESAYDLVEWIADQDWSTGKVGMIGGSYEGTTATAAAVMDPPHLTTIVPEAAVSRWYGYAYSGGIRYTFNNEVLSHQGIGAVDDEAVSTPVAYDLGLAIPPPVDPAGPGWAERVQSTITPCDELEHTQRGYDDTPDYDEFWRERDYVKDARKIDIPVLVAHNWGDWNVKQEHGWDLFQALKRSPHAVMYFGTRWDDHNPPADEDYAKTVRQWFDHYLLGIDNGAHKLPPVISQTSDYDGAGKWFRGRAPKTTPVELIAQYGVVSGPGENTWKLLPTKPNLRALSLIGEAPPNSAFPSSSINTESHAAHHCPSNHDWWCFESLPLARDMRIFGTPKVQIYSSVQRRWITYTPSIIDKDHDAHQQVGNQHASTDPKALVGVTRGWLDSRYRNGLDEQVELQPGKPFLMTVVAKPQDYVFKKGHSIVLNIQTEINEWHVPKVYPGCDKPPEPGSKDDCVNVRIRWEESKTRLILPVVNAPKDPGDLFVREHQH